ncbi:hypothetical protein N8I82_08720 [Granulicatella adiacens]|uniref:hypothetical protein n=2 Tax=Granulicatella TaxID=117563 RepID=UPI0021DAE9DC|nr:hypothetical protein [Granulicatella adiacens]UXY41269.1 hypothetical protein N8I82_08720 [Granulicatella adiacens]
MMNKHVCKKCNRELPEGFKKDICEHCQNKRVDLLQKVGAGLATGLVAVVGIAVKMINNNSKK